MPRQGLFGSSLTKKYWMALTGFFLITFLIVHAGINSMIFFDDGGLTFNFWAHFMGTNLIIRTMEIVLFAGLLLHIIDGLMLWSQNRDARPVKYAMEKGGANRRWYSEWMGLLGTLILLFLIVHLWHFWVKTRNIIGDLDAYGIDTEGRENLFARMVDVFSNKWVVVIYVFGCFSLFWHLLHGFKSAFQSLGINHKRYTPIIAIAGAAFSIIVPALFAAMPISMYLGWIK